MALSTFDRVLSQITDVYFQGWKSDTLTLQQAGWEFSSLVDHGRYCCRFAIKNRHLRLEGVSEMWRYDHSWIGKWKTQEPHPPICINAVASQVVTHGVTMPEFNRVCLDMTPQVITREVQSLEDLFPFAAKEEILVSRQADMSVVDHLEAILDQQRAKQDEIWDRMKTGERTRENTEKQTLLRLVA